MSKDNVITLKVSHKTCCHSRIGRNIEALNGFYYSLLVIFHL